MSLNDRQAAVELPLLRSLNLKGRGIGVDWETPSLPMFKDLVSSGGVKGKGKKGAGLGDPKKGSERLSQQIPS